MKRHLIIALLLITGLAATTETPMVLNQLSGLYQVVIDPGLGTATLVQWDGVLLRRWDSVNFIADLKRLQDRIVDVRNGKVFNTLQLGSGNNQPTGEEMLASLPDQVDAAMKEAGIPSLQERARAGEVEFWNRNPKYDGVTYGALSEQVLMLVVPSLRTVLFYNLIGNTIKLIGWRNFGPDLLIPQAFNSRPSPQDVLQQLPVELREDFKKRMQDQAVALANAANKALELKTSEVWVGAGTLDRFILVDYANNRVITYDLSTRPKIRLSGVRNIEIDLMIPNAFHAGPEQNQIFQAFLNDPRRKQFLQMQEFVPFDLHMLHAIAAGAAASAGGKISPVHAHFVNNNLDAMVDFHQARKLLVYRLFGFNNNLELMSVRDSTLDAALAALDAEIINRTFAADSLEDVRKLVNQRKKETALLVLATTLRLDPGLVAVVEKDGKISAFLGQEAEYKKMIEDALAAAKAREEARVAAIKSAAKAREEEKKRRSGR